MEAVRLHAGREIERRRQSFEATGNACEILACLQLCLVHGLWPPHWVRAGFIQRHESVTGAHVASWDEAFGPPWPARTRLDSVRRRRILKRMIHAHVWTLVEANPSRPIDRDLFAEVGEMQGILKSGSTVEKLYYESIDEGAPSVALIRQQAQSPA